MMLSRMASLATPVTYVDDVFSAYTYTGNGSTQTITNGIDLAGKGGMVWIKSRSNAARSHGFWDSVRGINKWISSSSTSAQLTATTGNAISSFNSNGFSLGSDSESWGVNNNTDSPYISWTFRKAPKFFDVVTYTGTGSSPNNVTHSLGVTPGMIFVKDINNTQDWGVSHRGSGGSTVRRSLSLNLTANALNTADAATYMGTASTFDASTINTAGGVSLNTSGRTYVAYIFAHDDSADSKIKCGTFTTDGSWNATVELGWEPQFVMIKPDVTGDWVMCDAARGFHAGLINSKTSLANSSADEATGNFGFAPYSTGFKVIASGANQTNIYVAIRRPNKPPTTGTQVFNTIVRTGTSANATVTGVGFAPDAIWGNLRSGHGGSGTAWALARLTGLPYLGRNSTAGEMSMGSDSFLSYEMDGYKLGADTMNGNFNYPYTMVHWCFKRAVGVFDVVCYTSAANPAMYSHNLTVVPEFIIQKTRNTTNAWYVYHSSLGVNKYLELSSSAVPGTITNMWTVNASAFRGETDSGYNDIAYLFASKAGISKVGGYTGNGGTAATNGTSQTIDCGFSAGARFILIKRTDSAGSWYVFDSARGIIASADPIVYAGSTAEEVTTVDAVDPVNSGFIVNQESTTNLNVTSATYIYLAIA